jgi:hypothetical protein
MACQGHKSIFKGLSLPSSSSSSEEELEEEGGWVGVGEFEAVGRMCGNHWELEGSN